MSALVVCLICDRQRVLWFPRGVLICSNCGAHDPQIIKDNDRKAWTTDWNDKDGLAKIDACRRAYAGLKWLRDTRNYKPKWADARYRAIFGCWPQREIEHVSPEPPTANLIRRVRLDNQHWKKHKREEERARTIAVDPDPLLRFHEGTPSFMTAADWDVKL